MKLKTIQPKTPPQPGVSIRLTNKEARDLQSLIYYARSASGGKDVPLNKLAWPAGSIGYELLSNLNSAIGAL